MWSLTPRLADKAAADAPPPLLLPVPGRASTTYSVGRKNTDILLASKGVSKSHAEFSIGSDGALLVRDCGSSFGTMINKLKVEGEPRPLAEGDTLTFSASIKYDVHRMPPLVVCSSQVSKAEKKVLKDACDKLGTELVANWRADVTHLVMSSVSLTPKFLVAIASVVPVVSPQWLARAAARASPTEPLPSVDEPSLAPKPSEVAETSQLRLPPHVERRRPERAKLFAERKFVHVPSAGGAAQEDMRELLKLMGAALGEWPAGAPASQLAQLAAEGYSFVVAEGSARTSAEALAASRAGANVYEATTVRGCLMQASLASLRPISCVPAAAPT